MKTPVLLHLVHSASLSHTVDDPMLQAIAHYERHIDGIDEPGLSDKEVGRQFATALSLIQREPGPRATTAAGAAAALRLVLGFHGVDPTDRALIVGALAYLDGRKVQSAIGARGT